MNYVERSPSVFEATQFNKEGDHPLVKRGYRQQKRPMSTTVLYVSESMPRSFDCAWAWILTGPHNFEEIKVTDWVVKEVGNPRHKIYTNEEFEKRFMPQPETIGVFA